MASQLYTFPLTSAFVGTMAASQGSQRSTYTVNVTLTLKPERQLVDSGFLSKGSNTSDTEFILLIHTGPQQLVRLYLAEFVQTSGQPMPYELEHRESKNAIRLRYEPSLGERCQVGAEFTKRSDFLQAAQLLERLGLRFRPQESTHPSSHILESRSALASPPPLGLSPTIPSLSNRRAGSALSNSQRSWSPLNWASRSSPLSQTMAPKSHWPLQMHYSATASPTSRSESPGIGIGQSLQSQSLQNNLFISQDITRTSEPPQVPPSRPSCVMRLEASPSPLFFDHVSGLGENLSDKGSRGVPTASYFPPSSSLSDVLSQGRSEVEDFANLMPPPRRLPFSPSKKSKLASKARTGKTMATTEAASKGASQSTRSGQSVPRQDDRLESLAAAYPTPHDKTRLPSSKADATPAAAHDISSDPSTTRSKPAPKNSRRSQAGADTSRNKRQCKNPEEDKSPTKGVESTRSSYRDAEVQTGGSNLETKSSGEDSESSRSGRGKPRQERLCPDAETGSPEPPRRPGLRSSKTQDAASASPMNPQILPSCAKPKNKFRNASSQTKMLYKDHGSSCHLRLPDNHNSTQTVILSTSTGTSCDVELTSHRSTQTDSDTREAAMAIQRRRPYIDNGVQTRVAMRDAETTCNISTMFDATATGTQTELYGESLGTKKTPDPTSNDFNVPFYGETLVAAFQLINNARDLMHQHVDDDLDRMEQGVKVDLEHSMCEMLQEVENLAQVALDEHGPAMLEIPFVLMARDYLRTREVDTDM